MALTSWFFRIGPEILLAKGWSPFIRTAADFVNLIKLPKRESCLLSRTINADKFHDV